MHYDGGVCEQAWDGRSSLGGRHHVIGFVVFCILYYTTPAFYAITLQRRSAGAWNMLHPHQGLLCFGPRKGVISIYVSHIADFQVSYQYFVL